MKRESKKEAIMQKVKEWKTPLCFTKNWTNFPGLDFPNVEKPASMSGNKVEIKTTGTNKYHEETCGRNKIINKALIARWVLNIILIFKKLKV